MYLYKLLVQKMGIKDMNGIRLLKKIRRVYSGGLWRQNIDTIENIWENGIIAMTVRNEEII